MRALTTRHIFLFVLLFASACKETPEGPVPGAGQGMAPVSPEQESTPDVVESTPPDILPPLQEIEPNDRKTPMAVESGRSVDASISSKKDNDWYRIVPDGEKILRVAITGIPDLDLSLSLYDDSGRKLQRKVNNTAKNGEEIITNFLIQEPMLIRVQKGKGSYAEAANEYSLIAVLNPPSSSDEREPNGSTGKATALIADETIRGYLNNPEDKDIFRLEGGDPAFIRLEAEAPGDTGMVVKVFRRTMKNATSIAVPAGHSTSIDGIGLGNSPLYVAIESDGAFDVLRTYSVEVLEGNPPLDSQNEPNDSAERAAAFSTDAPINGVIGWVGDKDWFALPNKAKGVYQIELQPEGDGLLSLHAKGTNHSQSLKNAPSRTPMVLPNIPANKGKVYVRVSSADNRAEPPPGYSLSATWREAFGEEMEPNNTMEGLTEPALEPGVERRGYIPSASDVDLFPLKIEEGTAAIVTVRFDAPSEINIRGRLLDQEGKEMAASPFISAGSAGTFTHYVEPGDYLVEVRTGMKQTNSSTPYSVVLLP